ncbi:MAG: MBL fold metallo-hydrolase [Bacteriovoracaceae bacterium]
MPIQVRQLFESETSTYTYLLFDEISLEALIIDPLCEMRERDLRLINELSLKLKCVVATHVHADHATSAAFLKNKTEAKIALSKEYNLGKEDISLSHGDQLLLENFFLEQKGDIYNV